MPEKSYLEKNRGVITSSKLAAFEFCQYLYFLQYEKEVVPEKQTDPMLFGTAFDDFHSYGEEEWNKKYIVVDRKIDPEELHEKVVAKNAQHEKAKTPATKEKYLAELKELEKRVGVIQLPKSMGEKLERCNTEAARQPLWKFDREKAQVEIIVDYKGEKLKCTIDQLRLDEEIICDVKTSGAIHILLTKFREKYIRQLTFYQLLVELKHDKKCSGELQVATTEDPSHFVKFSLSKEGLNDQRGSVLESLDALIAAKRRGIFTAQPQDLLNRTEKCFNCAAYNVCPHSIQKQPFQLC